MAILNREFFNQCIRVIGFSATEPIFGCSFSSKLRPRSAIFKIIFEDCDRNRENRIYQLKLSYLAYRAYEICRSMF